VVFQLVHLSYLQLTQTGGKSDIMFLGRTKAQSAAVIRLRPGL